MIKQIDKGADMTFGSIVDFQLEDSRVTSGVCYWWKIGFHGFHEP